MNNVKNKCRKIYKDDYKVIRFKIYLVNELNNEVEKEKDKLKVYEIAHILFDWHWRKRNINKLKNKQYVGFISIILINKIK